MNFDLELLSGLVDIGIPALVALLTALVAYKKLSYTIEKWEEKRESHDSVERRKLRLDLIEMVDKLRAELNIAEQKHRQCENDLLIVTAELAAIKKYLNVDPRV